MYKLILAFILLLPLTSRAFDLKVGDVLLQPLNCWSCTLIEAQEGSIYSHMGIVIETYPTVKVAEALGRVRILSLQEFNARTERGQRLSVRRFKDQVLVRQLQVRRYEFMRFFQSEFEGLQYDDSFVWDNLDEYGREKLYCSEMVTKFLNAFLGVDLPTKIMKYDINRDLWIDYFRGTPPDGKPGNAPADFEKLWMFYEVGQI